MPSWYHVDTGTLPGAGTMRSSAGFELLACCTIVGTPRSGIPKSTVSTNPRVVGVAYFML